ncbi:MAG: hypothetical protein IPP79_21400 [Chitinophagaceae bacterium]|nr:hypothetical protein [Chitinophagaceae bacterium]
MLSVAVIPSPTSLPIQLPGHLPWIEGNADGSKMLIYNFFDLIASFTKSFFSNVKAIRGVGDDFNSFDLKAWC